MILRVQKVGQQNNVFPHREMAQPRRGKALIAIERTGDLAADRRRRVRVVTEVRCRKDLLGHASFIGRGYPEPVTRTGWFR